MPNESPFIKKLFAQPMKEEEAAPYESALVRARAGEIPYITNAQQIMPDPQLYLIDTTKSFTDRVYEPGIIRFDAPLRSELPDIKMAPGLLAGPPSVLRFPLTYLFKKAGEFPENDYIKEGQWYPTTYRIDSIDSDSPLYPYPPPAGGRRRKTRRRTIKKRRRTRSRRTRTA